MAVDKQVAKLLFTKLVCHHDSEYNGDDIYFEVYLDDDYHDTFGNYIMKAGDTAGIDIEIEVTYLNKIKLVFKEDDGSSGDDYVGEVIIERGSAVDADMNGNARIVSPEGEKDLSIYWRIITNPIPTVRIHGVYCEESSAGMNVDLADSIADSASTVCDAASDIFGKNPRPSRQVISEAFSAASTAIQLATELAKLIGAAVEGPDDVYMIHKYTTDNVGTGFFPPHGGIVEMDDGQQVICEEQYGEYFRFPLDTGEPVTIQLMESDAHTKDIIIGSLIVDPAEIKMNSSDGISGGSPDTDYKGVQPIEGKPPVYDGDPVIQVANAYYGKQNGEGAVYYLCYSVGTEDWGLPASSYGQISSVRPDMWYNLKNYQSQEYADARPGTWQEGQILSWGAETGTNQHYQFEPAGDDNFKILCRHTMNYWYTRGQPGDDITLTNGTPTKFKIEDLTNNVYRITVNGNPVKLNREGSDVPLELGSSGDTSTLAKWKFETKGPANRWYALRCKEGGHVFNTRGDRKILTYPFSESTGSANEQYQIIPLQNGKVKIFDRWFQKCANIGTNAGNPLGIPDEGVNNYREFDLIRLDNGYYRFVTPEGRFLGVENAGQDVKIIAYNNNETGSKTQWELKLVNTD